MSLEILGLILLGALFVIILIGFPISFTLIFLALGFGYIGLGIRVFYLMTFQYLRGDDGTRPGGSGSFYFYGLLVGGGRTHGPSLQGFATPFWPYEGIIVFGNHCNGDTVCGCHRDRGRICPYPWVNGWSCYEKVWI